MLTSNFNSLTKNILLKTILKIKFLHLFYKKKKKLVHKIKDNDFKL